MKHADDPFRDFPLTIVDIGASGGIHPRWHALTSSMTAVLFEPDPRAQEALRRRTPPNTIILGCALADKAGPMRFHQCRKQEVSSVYVPNTELLSTYPYPERFTVTRSMSLQADTLDNQLRQANVDNVDFVKLDAQGFELSILRGGLETLAGVIGLEIEVQFVPVYTGQPLFCEVDGFVRGHGYSLIDMRRVFWRRGNSSEHGANKGQLVCADVLYFRTPEQMLCMENVTTSQVLRAMGVYLAYGYSDLAQVLVANAEKAGLFNTEQRKAATAVIGRFKSHWMPDFPGRSRIKRLAQRIASLFDDQSPYTGADDDLGNLTFRVS